MTANLLEKVFEHNNWANSHIIQACSVLNEEQLDAEPRSATIGSIRRALWHLVAAQEGYLSLLTGTDHRSHWPGPPPMGELLKAASITGEALLALARDTSGQSFHSPLQTRDGFNVEPWVVMVQVINHATEHREQIKSMLSSLGITPPEIDGWTYGEVTNALTPIES